MTREMERMEFELGRCGRGLCAERAEGTAVIEVPGLGECHVQLCGGHMIQYMSEPNIESARAVRMGTFRKES